MKTFLTLLEGNGKSACHLRNSGLCPGVCSFLWSWLFHKYHIHQASRICEDCAWDTKVKKVTMLRTLTK